MLATVPTFEYTQARVDVDVGVVDLIIVDNATIAVVVPDVSDDVVIVGATVGDLVTFIVVEPLKRFAPSSLKGSVPQHIHLCKLTWLWLRIR